MGVFVIPRACGLAFVDGLAARVWMERVKRRAGGRQLVPDGEVVVVVGGVGARIGAGGAVVVAGGAEARAGVIAVAGVIIALVSVRIMVIIAGAGLQGGFSGGFELRIGNFAEELGFGVLGGRSGVSGCLAVFGWILGLFFGGFLRVFAFGRVLRRFERLFGFLAIHERFGLCRAVFGLLARLRGNLRFVSLFFGDEDTEVFQTVSFLPFGGVRGEFELLKVGLRGGSILENRFFRVGGGENWAISSARGGGSVIPCPSHVTSVVTASGVAVADLAVDEVLLAADAAGIG